MISLLRFSTLGANFKIMKNVLSIILILTVMGCTQQATFTYPETAKGDVVDDYHGTEVPDPYRWLEDDMSDETAAWVKAQNKVTFSYLESIPFRDALKARMTEICNYPKMGTPFKEGDLYFYKIEGDMTDRIGAIDTNRCPVYILTGEYDYSCTPEDSKDTAANIKGSELVIMKELGHFPMSENPEKFRSYILPVLEKILASEGQ